MSSKDESKGEKNSYEPRRGVAKEQENENEMPLEVECNCRQIQLCQRSKGVTGAVSLRDCCDFQVHCRKKRYRLVTTFSDFVVYDSPQKG